MQMFAGALVCLAFVATVSSAGVSLPRTQSLISHLHGLATKGSSLQTCLTSVNHPLKAAAHFSTDVRHVMDIVHRLEGRVETITDVIEAVMLIPYVGIVASPVLDPAVSVLKFIDKGLKSILRKVDSVVKILFGWLKPIESIEHRIAIVLAKMTMVTRSITKAEHETATIEKCVETLPDSIRSDAEDALEHASGFFDIIPKGVNAALGVVNQGCHGVQGFLHKLHLTRRKRSFPSFQGFIRLLEHIDGALGPIGHFMDVVHKAMNKRICLIGDLIKIGGIVVHEAEHIGQEIIKGAEHLGQEIAHETEHIGQEIAHTAANVVHTAEHIGQEIAHVAANVEKTVVHGVVNLGNQIAHTAEHVEHQIVNTATDVGHKIVSGTTDLGNQIAHTAETVGQQIAHTATDVGNKIGGFFHNLFGRRSSIDGRYYIIVDEDYDFKKRGIDVCFSIHGALNFVNGVTHGMLGEAKKFIAGVFHAKSPFHVPGLTQEALHFGDILQKYHIRVPDVSHLLRLAGREVDKFLSQKPIDDYIKAVPVCKAAVNGLHG